MSYPRTIPGRAQISGKHIDEFSRVGLVRDGIPQQIFQYPDIPSVPKHIYSRAQAAFYVGGGDAEAFCNLGIKAGREMEQVCFILQNKG